MNKKICTYLVILSIERYVHILYSIIKIKVRQTNNPKGYETESHILVRRYPRRANKSQEDASVGCLANIRNISKGDVQYEEIRFKQYYEESVEEFS